MNDTDLVLSGDFVDDAVKMISASNVEKTIIPGNYKGEDVFVLCSVIPMQTEEMVVIPLALIMTEKILDEIDLPDDIQEVPPPIPMNSRIDGAD